VASCLFGVTKYYFSAGTSLSLFYGFKKIDVKFFLSFKKTCFCIPKCPSPDSSGILFREYWRRK